MWHYITHCKGNDCPLKDNCYRYLAYQEPYDFPISVFQNAQYKDGECEYFMDVEVWQIRHYFYSGG